MNIPNTIAIIGLGGLGLPVLLRLLNEPLDLDILIFEDDYVELSNLPRQVIFTELDIKKKKTQALRETLAIEQYVNLIKNKRLSYTEYMLTEENISELTGQSFIIDCTDDPKIKLLLSDYCKLNNKVLIHAGAQGENGLVIKVTPEGPCLRCIFGDLDADKLEEAWATCMISGILGAYSGLTGIFQAELAILAIKGDFKSVGFKIDSRGAREISFEVDSNCPICFKHKELNLKEIKCPETFVYTKLALLKREASEEKILVHLKGEQELLSVESSIVEEGFTVISKLVQKPLNIYRLLVK